MKPIKYDELIKVGDVNEFLTVVEIPFKRNKKNRKDGIWCVKIKCKCGKEQLVPCVNWNRKEFKICRNCQLKGSNNYAWNGFGEIGGQFFCRTKQQAEERNIEYDVTKEYLWNLFLTQNRKCALTGVGLVFKTHKQKQTASLDRIDSSKGYIEGNLQWIHKELNIMKNKFDIEKFKRWCKLVVEYGN